MKFFLLFVGIIALSGCCDVSLNCDRCVSIKGCRFVITENNDIFCTHKDVTVGFSRIKATTRFQCGLVRDITAELKNANNKGATVSIRSQNFTRAHNITIRENIFFTTNMTSIVPNSGNTTIFNTMKIVANVSLPQKLYQSPPNPVSITKREGVTTATTTPTPNNRANTKKTANSFSINAYSGSENERPFTITEYVNKTENIPSRINVTTRTPKSNTPNNSHTMEDTMHSESDKVKPPTSSEYVTKWENILWRNNITTKTLKHNSHNKSIESADHSLSVANVHSGSDKVQTSTSPETKRENIATINITTTTPKPNAHDNPSTMENVNSSIKNAPPTSSEYVTKLGNILWRNNITTRTPKHNSHNKSMENADNSLSVANVHSISDKVQMPRNIATINMTTTTLKPNSHDNSNTMENFNSFFKKMYFESDKVQTTTSPTTESRSLTTIVTIIQSNNTTQNLLKREKGDTMKLSNSFHMRSDNLRKPYRKLEQNSGYIAKGGNISAANNYVSNAREKGENGNFNQDNFIRHYQKFTTRRPEFFTRRENNLPLKEPSSNTNLVNVDHGTANHSINDEQKGCFKCSGRNKLKELWRETSTNYTCMSNQEPPVDRLVRSLCSEIWLADSVGLDKLAAVDRGYYLMNPIRKHKYLCGLLKRKSSKCYIGTFAGRIEADWDGALGWSSPLMLGIHSTGLNCTNINQKMTRLARASCRTMPLSYSMRDDLHPNDLTYAAINIVQKYSYTCKNLFVTGYLCSKKRSRMLL